MPWAPPTSGCDCVTPTSVAPIDWMLRPPVGTASSSACGSTCCVTACCTSTTGDAPDTVTVSCRSPTRSSALTGAVKFAGSSTPLRSIGHREMLSALAESRRLQHSGSTRRRFDMRAPLTVLLTASVVLTLSSAAFVQEKGGDDRTGPYDVVAGWPQPLALAKPGYIWGSTGGIFAETPNRIFIANRG